MPQSPRASSASGALVALYRVRTLLSVFGVLVLLAFALFGSHLSGAGVAMRVAIGVVAIAAMIAIVLGLLLPVLGSRILPERQEVVVNSPVLGRWAGLNSPATKVPSHGIRAYGQAYAIDLVHEPADGTRPVFGDGPAMRDSSEYPAFGQPVFAMIDGVVVRASDWRRDHRARSTMPAVVYMMIEGVVRELGGSGFVLGNHVTIRGDDGVIAMVAHLQQGSLRVRVGDRVVAGDQIGCCGNSGNTSEPHVHAQLMDRAWPVTAQGIPLAFRGITLDDDTKRVDAVPADEQHMTASA